MKNEVENPWEEIKKDKYILSEDFDRIVEFNNTVKSITHLIQTELIPDPFFGNKDANVVLLMLNPGFGGNEKDDYKKKNFEQVLLNNLTHKNIQKHFFSLDKTFELTEAYKYWEPKVKELNDAGFTNNFLSENIFCVNLFPYHSNKYKKLKGKLLKSQKYALHLLNKKIRNENSLIISMRSYKPWAKAYSDEYKGEKTFDELVKMKKILRVNSYGNPTLSYKNLLQKDGSNGFEILINQLKKNL